MSPHCYYCHHLAASAIRKHDCVNDKQSSADKMIYYTYHPPGREQVFWLLKSQTLLLKLHNWVGSFLCNIKQKKFQLCKKFWDITLHFETITDPDSPTTVRQSCDWCLTWWVLQIECLKLNEKKKSSSYLLLKDHFWFPSWPWQFKSITLPYPSDQSRQISSCLISPLSIYDMSV